jgi:hypothetical protein
MLRGPGSFILLPHGILLLRGEIHHRHNDRPAWVTCLQICRRGVQAVKMFQPSAVPAGHNPIA